jgi:tRNA nucleotidyltransferase/poly(A) polymerase|tara:strand:- start:1542 stop:2300 length:759 start_codon:yes stop_codon:yes gene_type:complete
MSSNFENLLNLANRYMIDKPRLVGGFPRDFLLNEKGKTFDYDITTNSPDSIRLGILFSDEVNKPFRLFKKGNLKVMFDDFSYDFSPNFESDGAKKFLRDKGVSDNSLAESYSRDFTINTLQQDLITMEISDPTGLGIDDINRGLIRTPIPAEITISDDPRRIFRAIGFATRYNMDIDDNIINYVKNNVDNIFKDDSEIKDSFIVSKIGESIGKNADMAMDLIMKMNLLKKIPLEGAFKEQVVKRRMILDYLD